MDYYTKNLGCGMDSELGEAKEGLTNELDSHDYMRNDGRRY